jgi:glutamate 5-kinase
MSSYKRLVVKLGSNTLTAGGDRLNRPQMLELVRQIASLHRQGHEIIVVSSGAVAAGREVLGVPQSHQSYQSQRGIPFKQMLAAVGQAHLMRTWTDLFGIYGIAIAQTLLTRGDLANRQRYLNARNTLLALLDRGVITIINENDTVAVDEIRIGDNDNLSAQVATLVDADLLVLLTDTDGLFTADPRTDPSATLIPEIAQADPRLERLTGRAGSARGTGGMATKIQAARLATQGGVAVVIANGQTPDILTNLATGLRLGTLFHPAPSSPGSRQCWIASGWASRGQVQVDAGAARALLRGGSSLLPAGITQVTGRFQRGDAVDILDPAGQRIASGIANYAWSDAQRIAGLHSDRIEETLGYEYGEEVIHRNNLVIVGSRSETQPV